MDMKPYLVILALAFLAEAFTEYFFASWIDLAKKKWPTLDIIKPLKYISAAVGLMFAFAYDADLLRDMLGAVANPAWFGVVNTGLIIGRGANFVNDFGKKYLGLNT